MPAVAVERNGGEIPMFYAGGYNKGVKNSGNVNLQKSYNSGQEAAKLDGSDH